MQEIAFQRLNVSKFLLFQTPLDVLAPSALVFPPYFFHPGDATVGIAKMFCPFCREAMQASFMYCPFCGRVITVFVNEKSIDIDEEYRR